MKQTQHRTTDLPHRTIVMVYYMPSTILGVLRCPQATDF